MHTYVWNHFVSHHALLLISVSNSGIPRNFFRGGSTNSVEDREDGDLSGVPRNFVRGGSTNSVEDRENRDLEAVAP